MDILYILKYISQMQLVSLICKVESNSQIHSTIVKEHSTLCLNVSTASLKGDKAWAELYACWFAE